MSERTASGTGPRHNVKLASASAPTSHRALIVGCGRKHRQDDAAGLRIAELLTAGTGPGVTILQTEAPGTDLLTECSDADLLVIVDSARANEDVLPNRWRRFVVKAGSLRDEADAASAVICSHGAGCSGHSISVADAIRMGMELQLLPDDVWLYAIAGRDFGYGDAFSVGVESAIHEAADAIRRDIRSWRDGHGETSHA